MLSSELDLNILQETCNFNNNLYYRLSHYNYWSANLPHNSSGNDITKKEISSKKLLPIGIPLSCICVWQRKGTSTTWFWSGDLSALHCLQESICSYNELLLTWLNLLYQLINESGFLPHFPWYPRQGQKLRQQGATFFLPDNKWSLVPVVANKIHSSLKAELVEWVSSAWGSAIQNRTSGIWALSSVPSICDITLTAESDVVSRKFSSLEPYGFFLLCWNVKYYTYSSASFTLLKIILYTSWKTSANNDNHVSHNLM